MAKNSIRDYDATSGNNTDVQSVDISEGCAASGINNAIREVMADLKDVSTGTVKLETPGADQLNVDNLRLDGNTISSTDTNGNLTLDPDGTGAVAITGGFTASDGCTITTADNTSQLTLTSTDADSGVGPRLDLKRDSGSPADNDALGRVRFLFDNDAGQETEAILFTGIVSDVSDGTEDAKFTIATMIDGTNRERVAMTNTEVVFNDDSIDSDFRVESDAKTAAFFVEGGGGTDGFIGLNTSTPQKMLHLVKNDSDGIMIFDADGTTTDHQIVFAKDYGTGAVTGGNYFGVGVDGSENDFIIAFDANSQASLAADKILSLTHDGNLAVDGSSSTGGADYAEYFEWSDGNSSNEDRRGYSVVLTGNKIRKATSDDAATSIIGVVSSTPACLGDSAWKDWHGKYEKDDYGNYIMQNGERVLSSSYDNTQTYVPRKDRNEWDAIGMVGKLRLRAGQPTGDRWIKLRDIATDDDGNVTVEEWLVR